MALNKEKGGEPRQCCAAERATGTGPLGFAWSLRQIPGWKTTVHQEDMAEGLLGLRSICWGRRVCGCSGGTFLLQGAQRQPGTCCVFKALRHSPGMSQEPQAVGGTAATGISLLQASLSQASLGCGVQGARGPLPPCEQSSLQPKPICSEGQET